MSEIVWQDPPPTKWGKYKRAEDPRMAAMKANPGRWLLFATLGHTGGARTTSLRRAGFEVTQRSTPDGLYDLYARWPEEVPAT